MGGISEERAALGTPTPGRSPAGAAGPGVPAAVPGGRRRRQWARGSPRDGQLVALGGGRGTKAGGL